MLGNKPPYTTMQQLNLDWILSKLKTLLRLVPDDGVVGQILRRTRDGAVWSDEQGGAVESVNGQTGAVVLDAADVGALPEDYTPPVTSVNGQTGAVVIPTGGAVESVNGQTGAVVLDAADVGALPDDYTPPVTSVNGETGAVVLGKSDVGLPNVDNVKQFSATNPPPYPVTSVNGQTGAVVIQTGGSPLDAYPIGSIYMSVNSTSPATLFGGAWEQLENRFLLGAGSAYAAGSSGGSATHEHTTGSHKLTVNEMPSHSHKYTDYYNVPQGSAYKAVAFDLAADPTGLSVKATGGNAAHSHGNTGTASSLPPYLAVYMWKRTA